MRVKRRIYKEKEKQLSTLYLRLLIIVDFLTILVSGAYAPLVLMPRRIRYSNSQLDIDNRDINRIMSCGNLRCSGRFLIDIPAAV